MRRCVLLLVLAAGCVSERGLSVRVVKPGGAPLEGVVVAAELAIFNSDPDTCIVTAARAGYQTKQVDAAPGGTLTVEPEPAP